MAVLFECPEMNHFRKFLIGQYIYMYSNVYFMYFYTFLLALLVSEDNACCWEAARDSKRSEPWPYDPRRRVCGARRMLEGPHDVSMKGQLYIYIL